MKFVISERIKTNKEKSLVFSKLKESLEKISRKVETQGNMLVVESIASTFGSITRKDRTEVTLQEKENGFLLTADVDYKPSIAFWIITTIILVGGIIGSFTGIIGIFIPIGMYLWNKSLVKIELEKCFLNIKNEFDE